MSKKIPKKIIMLKFKVQLNDHVFLEPLNTRCSPWACVSVSSIHK